MTNQFLETIKSKYSNIKCDVYRDYGSIKYSNVAENLHAICKDVRAIRCIGFYDGGSFRWYLDGITFDEFIKNK